MEEDYAESGQTTMSVGGASGNLRNHNGRPWGERDE